MNPNEIKTVLILSEQNDYSTSEVLDWIHYFGGNTIRISKETDIQFIEIDPFTNKTAAYILFVNGKTLRSENVFSYWYRRGDLQLKNKKPDLKDLKDTIQTELNYHLNAEFNVLEQMIHFINENKRSIGSFHNANLNKLEVLMEANKLGLKIPDTKIIVNSNQVKKHSENGKNLITKAISEALLIGNMNGGIIETFMSYTEEIKNTDSEHFFFPSLVQEKIKKIYELRIFYLHGSFFSMAIFSQKDLKTETDFRKYNKKKPNRFVPFLLPIKIADKLHLLMQKLKLNTGSIDMIVTKKQEYIFLEINPVGQFGMVSDPCNYKLEKRIAKYLLNL